MTTVFYLIVTIYSTFILNTAALPIQCSSSPSDWCKTKEIAAACGVCTNVVLLLFLQ